MKQETIWGRVPFFLGEWVEHEKGYRLPNGKTQSRVTGKTIDRKDNMILLEVPGLDEPIWVEGKAIVRILR